MSFALLYAWPWYLHISIYWVNLSWSSNQPSGCHAFRELNPEWHTGDIFIIMLPLWFVAVYNEANSLGSIWSHRLGEWKMLPVGMQALKKSHSCCANHSQDTMCQAKNINGTVIKSVSPCCVIVMLVMRQWTVEVNCLWALGVVFVWITGWMEPEDTRKWTISPSLWEQLGDLFSAYGLQL